MQKNLSLFNNENIDLFDFDDSCSAHYYKDFLSFEESVEYFKTLENETLWREDTITMFGKTHLVPRLQAWYGDKGTDYTYSKILLKPKPWTNNLIKLKEKIESLSQVQFNSVLLNFYRDGSDYVAWHSDDEKELGDKPVIASLTLGEERRFILRNKESKKKVEVNLENGSLLIMSGETQKKWEHQLPRSKKIHLPRINCTFRKVIR